MNILKTVLQEDITNRHHLVYDGTVFWYISDSPPSSLGLTSVAR